MNDWFIYLIKAEIGLLLFFAGYYFFFQNDKFFLFNRLYLLGALLLSVIIPFFQINFSEISVRVDGIISRIALFLKGSEPMLAETNLETLEVSTGISILSLDMLTILSFIYLAGVSFFLARFFLNFSKLFLFQKRITSQNLLVS